MSDGVCPKCGTAPREGAAACVRCGLALSRWGSFEAAPPPHPALDVLWPELEEHWEDDARHARLLEVASTSDGLDVAAARYGEILRRRPGDARATAAMGRIAFLVEQLHAMQSRAPRIEARTVRTVRGAAWAMVLVLAAAIAWVIYGVAVQP